MVVFLQNKKENIQNTSKSCKCLIQLEVKLMIITITANPSVDKLYKIKQLTPGTLNRVKVQKKMVGGKGINAARVAALIGSKTMATGFIGGQNGKYILSQTVNDNYLPNFIETDKETRNCLTIIDENGIKTEINENGLPLDSSYYDKLKEYILNSIYEYDVSAISINGSLPTGIDYHYYVDLITNIRDVSPNIKILVDASGKIINQLINDNCIPDIIKPNEDELADFLSITPTTNYNKLKEFLKYDAKLSKIDIIFVSLGSKGALIKYYGNIYSASFEPIKAINTEGSGDAMVGGILSALDYHLNIKEIISNACAAGTANALNMKTGFIDLDTFNSLKKKILIKKLD